MAFEIGQRIKVTINPGKEHSASYQATYWGGEHVDLDRVLNKETGEWEYYKPFRYGIQQEHINNGSIAVEVI